MKKASLMIALSILTTINSFAQQKEPGRRSLKDIAASYTHDQQTNALAFQGLLGLLDVGLAAKMYSAAKSLQPDAIKIRELESQIRRTKTELSTIEDIYRTANANMNRSYGEITNSEIVSAIPKETGIESNARLDEMAAHQAITDKLNAKKRELSNFESQLKKLKVGFFSRCGRKGLTAVATTVGVVMVANLGARTYLVFVDESDPGLFPVLDLAAEKFDSIGGLELIDTISNKGAGTVNEIYTALAGKIGGQ
ncbi:MAG: hypothetical protein IPJ71_15350 [Bdellovibrionales bacterium]|nr:hypothetical protein [Bdellovibrionales bacterium]